MIFIFRRDNLEKWLIPCNISKYDVIGAFNKLNKIQWKQSSNVNKNDTVFIYLSKPISGIVYKCRVLRVDLPKVTINDRQFILDGSNYEDYGRYMELELIDIYSEPISLESLQENGLKGNPQGPRRITDCLSNFLNDYSEKIITLDQELTEKEFMEGKATTIFVNKYERNWTARNLAINHHGSKCEVCGFDFFEIYGEIGKGYIQVHHIVPIHSIGKEYKIDYKKDLIPICANCHVMVHKKINGQELTLEELKSIVKK